jgi:N-hydroxyarylamine O-acetyltransferase
MSVAARLDLEGYLARIGYLGPRRATRAVLETLHERHVTSIPFENADVRLGRPIHLELEAVEQKLVRARRGGYCFEQNTLFSAALRALGFEVRTLEARVRPPGSRVALPRTHMVLSVAAGGSRWLADVGFGGDGPLRPVPWNGALSSQLGVYRLVRDGPSRVLKLRRYRAWEDLYAFGPEPALPVDFEVGNHFTSTHPSSPFVRGLTVQSASATARRILRGRSYSVRREGGEVLRELTRDEVVTLVREDFGLALTREEVLAALEAVPGEQTKT